MGTSRDIKRVINVLKLMIMRYLDIKKQSLYLSKFINYNMKKQGLFGIILMMSMLVNAQKVLKSDALYADQKPLAIKLNYSNKKPVADRLLKNFDRKKFNAKQKIILPKGY